MFEGDSAAQLNLIASESASGSLSTQAIRSADTAAPPPVSGTVAARLSLSGRGRSIHELGSSATGSVHIALSRGTIRRSFAELAGVNLQGLGLMLSHDTTRRRRAVEWRASRRRTGHSRRKP